MKHEIDLKKYQLRTDLVIENISDLNNSISKNKEFDDIKVTTVTLNKEDADKISKKEGIYTTIEFSDITDSDNQKMVSKILEKCLKQLIKKMKIKDESSCLVIGLGNRESTPDSLGPLTTEEIIVTRHLYLLGEVDEGFRCVAATSPGVTGSNGIETLDFIRGIIEQIKPDFLIVIDALASNSIERVNKTIQMTNTGINPGSGVGNSRKEISKDTIGIPVIAIGIPTVVDAVSVVSDTINYMHKHYAFHKKFLDSPLNRLISGNKINYLKQEVNIDDQDKTSLLGLVGGLNQNEIRSLISDVLTPIGYNLMVTPKEIDFVVKKLSSAVALGINNALHKKTIK